MTGAGAAPTAAIRIVPFGALSGAQRDAAAGVLMRAFAHIPTTWDTPGKARAEVESFFTDPERTALAALDGDQVVGWIGLIHTYSHAFELHPLAVDRDHERLGIGAALVRALENLARSEGALTLYLGADDEFDGTSLYGADPYPDLLASLARIEAKGARHPLGFYLKVGFRLAGLIPDANGPGKPDILFAKRLG